VKLEELSREVRWLREKITEEFSRCQRDLESCLGG
jgi:hypothetical protein